MASRLRIDKPAVRTLLMTAHQDVVTISNEHLDDRLSKPFGAMALRAKVERLIGGPDPDPPMAA